MKNIGGNMDLTPIERTLFETLENTAKARETITYGEVGKILKVEPTSVGHLLFELQTKLNKEGYPPLNYLVVRRDTRMPGSGVNIPHHGRIIDPLEAQVEVWRHYSTKSIPKLSKKPGIILIKK
jgi:hypothetical protein